ncbi:MAG: hypothetical protein ACXW18_03020 [Pyrinomonadaceae bacterium]
MGAAFVWSSRRDGWHSIVADATECPLAIRNRALKATAKTMPTPRVEDRMDNSPSHKSLAGSPSQSDE